MSQTSQMACSLQTQLTGTGGGYDKKPIRVLVEKQINLVINSIKAYTKKYISKPQLKVSKDNKEYLVEITYWPPKD